MDYSIDSFIKVGTGFVPVADVNPPLKAPQYIEGAIVWKIGGETPFSETHWDLVDQLWAYIVNGLGELKDKGEYATYFPDQPLRLALKRIGRDRIEITVGDARQIVPASAFFASIAEGGRLFFSRMLALVPEGVVTWQRYLDELDRIA
jgi:hypothetical protein